MWAFTGRRWINLSNVFSVDPHYIEGELTGLWVGPADAENPIWLEKAEADLFMERFHRMRGN